MTEADVCDVLEARHQAPEWAFFRQVYNSTGYAAKRKADAVAMNLYPSKGHEVHGFEIKVSRSDWLSELKDGSKADAIQRYCDRWWVVAPKGVVKKEDLPATWGAMSVRGNSARVMVQATLNEHVVMDKGFMASLLRRGHENLVKHKDFVEGLYKDSVPRASIEKELQEQYELGKQQGECSARFRVEALAHAKLKKSVADFEGKTGIELNGWNGGSLAEQLRLGSALVHSKHRLRSWKSSLDRIHLYANEFLEAVNELESLEIPKPKQGSLF